MKPKESESCCSAVRVTIISSFFIFVSLLCLFTSMNEIHFQNMINFDRVTFFSNHTQQIPYSCKNENSASPTSSGYTDIRVLVGIIMQPDSYRHRHLLRHVYITQSPTNAQVEIKFVMCSLTEEDQRVLMALEIMRYNDIIILNCTDAENSTDVNYHFFSTLPSMLSNHGTNQDAVLRSTRPYDYVMKTNDDIYIRLNPLVESLRSSSRENMYYSRDCMGNILSWDLFEGLESTINQNEGNGPNQKMLADRLALVGAESFKCSDVLAPDIIAVHRLKNQDAWIKTLQYFNATKKLKPSKLYHIP